ncbi:MAG: hypothetical protein H0X66_09485 [Verrucomicrobia bacterium]|nr:hypothetical protein [Verrucomicrobiota bacterium]
MDGDLSYEIGRARASAKVRGPFLVACSACGKYYPERWREEHTAVCIRPGLKKELEQQPVSPSLPVSEIVPRGVPLLLRFATDPSCASGDAHAGVLSNQITRLRNAQQSILEQTINAASLEGNGISLRSFVVCFVEQKAKDLPREVRRAFFFELDRGKWNEYFEAVESRFKR